MGRKLPNMQAARHMHSGCAVLHHPSALMIKQAHLSHIKCSNIVLKWCGADSVVVVHYKCEI